MAAGYQDCRMYEAKFPEVDDVVMVQVRLVVCRPGRLPARVLRRRLRPMQVRDIAEMGAYVALLEYNGIEGMILLSELSRRRIRSITKLIKVRSRTARRDTASQK